MTTIIYRSALKFWGGVEPPTELAYIIEDHLGQRIVTFAEVGAEKRKRQREILERRRAPVDDWQACRIWVGFFDQNLMGGWQAFIDTYRQIGRHNSRAWIDRDRRWLQGPIMRLFPRPSSLFDCNPWEDWKEWFARKYKRRIQDRHPLGVALVWRRGKTEFRLPKPKKE